MKNLSQSTQMEDLYHPNLVERAIMKDLYQVDLNGTSKNGKSLSVKVKLKRDKMEELYYVS